MLLVWIILRHYSVVAATIISVIVYGIFGVMFAMWLSGVRSGPLSLFALSVLCLGTATLGIILGQVGWEHVYRQYWWVRTGHWTENDSAQTMAGARVDAAVVGFWNTQSGSSSTVAGTSVDPTRSASYKDGSRYCVAPVLSPDSISGGLIRVNYWAIGIDCCQNVGSFYCDDSRSYAGAYGVVALDGGFPCPTCNNEQFRKAVEKAEAAHGLVSTSGALFVQYVSDPHAVVRGFFWRGFVYVVLTSIGMLMLCAIFGTIMWYYGVGKGPVQGLGVIGAKGLTGFGTL